MIELLRQHLKSPTWLSVHKAFRSPARLALAASLALSLAALVMPIYTIQIYDRVLSSRSMSTLVAVTLITLLAVALTALLDLFRSIVFSRASAVFYAELEARVLAACRSGALNGGLGRRSRPLDDLEMVRSFFAGPVPGALFDLIFVPLILLVLFLIHPLLGAVSLALSVALVLLALFNRRTMQEVTDRAVAHMRDATDTAEAHSTSILLDQRLATCRRWSTCSLAPLPRIYGGTGRTIPMA